MNSRKTFVFHRPWNWRYFSKPSHQCRVFVNGVLISDIKNGEKLTLSLPCVPFYIIGISESREEDFPCTHVLCRNLSDDAPIHISIRLNSQITWHSAWEGTSDACECSPMLDRINHFYVPPVEEAVSLSDAEHAVLLCNLFLLDAADGIREILRHSSFDKTLDALEKIGDVVWADRLRTFLSQWKNIVLPMTVEERFALFESGAFESIEEEWYSAVFCDLRTLYREIIEYLLAHL